MGTEENFREESKVENENTRRLDEIRAATSKINSLEILRQASGVIDARITKLETEQREREEDADLRRRLTTSTSGRGTKSAEKKYTETDIRSVLEGIKAFQTNPDYKTFFQNPLYRDEASRFVRRLGKVSWERLSQVVIDFARFVDNLPSQAPELATLASPMRINLTSLARCIDNFQPDDVLSMELQNEIKKTFAIQEQK